MKKTTFTEESYTSSYAFIEEDFTDNQIEINKKAVLQNRLSAGEITADNPTAFLDGLLSAIKWIFLYVPGVAIIHIAMLGVALLYLYKESNYELIPSLGFVAVGIFLIMLSFGKLRDLRYLKIVAIIFLSSFLNAVLYDILAVFIKGDFFGLYARLTLPVIALIGYLAKRSFEAGKNVSDEPEYHNDL